MAHNRPCENATAPKCRCSGCGGSLHGWPGHLRLAREPAEVRDARRAAVDREWREALGARGRRPDRPRNPSRRMQRAAGAGSVIDVLDRLAEDPRRISRTEELGGTVEETFKELTKKANGANGREGARDIRRALPGHFWCSILAELSGAANTADRALDRVPEQAEELLRNGETPLNWGKIQFSLAGSALSLLWDHARPFIAPWDLENLLYLMRVLAVLICPDLGAHPQILRTCLLPLGREVLTEESELRLEQSFGLEPPPGPPA